VGSLSFETDVAGDGEHLALFLHGFPESKTSWRDQLIHVSRLGYTAWAPNMRGYGRSSRPSGLDAYHVDHLVEDVAGLADLARSEGKRSLTLIAHDWGGIVAWFFALRRVRPLRNLVVMNLPHPRRIVESLRTVSQLRRFWYIFFFQVPRVPEWVMTRGGGGAVRRVMCRTTHKPECLRTELLDELCRNAAEPGAMRAMLAYYRSLFRNRALRREALACGRLDVPTLLLWAEDDAFLGKELTYGTESLVRDLTIRYLPDTSHWLQQEASATVNDLLAEWLLR
jgi:pimeloyl-ACP methyl ester carboxylesterase